MITLLNLKWLIDQNERILKLEDFWEISCLYHEVNNFAKKNYLSRYTIIMFINIGVLRLHSTDWKSLKPNWWLKASLFTALIACIITSCFPFDLAKTFQSIASTVWTSLPFIPSMSTALNLHSLRGVQLLLSHVSFPADLKIMSRDLVANLKALLLWPLCTISK